MTGLRVAYLQAYVACLHIGWGMGRGAWGALGVPVYAPLHRAVPRHCRARTGAVLAMLGPTPSAPL